jgi:hypothetical protein
MENFLWMLAIAGGPIVLGAVLGYVLLTRRRLSPREEATRDEATKALYQKTQE